MKASILEQHRQNVLDLFRSGMDTADIAHKRGVSEAQILWFLNYQRSKDIGKSDPYEVHAR